MALDWSEVQPRRLPIYLLLGVSASMQGVKIAAVNNGVTTIYQELMGDPRSAQTVHISLITFSDQSYQMPMVPIQQFVPPQLSASGRGVALGGALHLLNESLESDVIHDIRGRKGDYKPLVFLLMDSAPTDHWQLEAERLKSLASARPANIIGLQIGNYADLEDVLGQVCTTAFKSGDATPENLRQFFVWVSDSETTSHSRYEVSGASAAIEVPPPPPESIVGLPDTTSFIPQSAHVPRVFVSHSHADDAFTNRLTADLRGAGIDVWVDVVDMRPGDFIACINDALAACDWLVLILTPEAISSSFVNLEVNAAINRALKGYMCGVIPVLAAPTEPRTIPATWDGLHRYDATHDYAAMLQDLLRALL